MLVGAGAALLPAAFQEQRRPPAALGRVAPVNDGATDELDVSANNSPTIVASPRDPRTLAIVNRIDSPRYSCALHVSADGARTWKQIPVPAPKGERECYAPDAAFTADGTLHMSFVTLRGAGHVPNAAWIVHSSDGGRTWSAPARVAGRLAFQVRLAADPSAPRRLYLTWVQGTEVGLYRFSTVGAPIRTMRSDDGGEHWEPSVQTSSRARARVLAPAPAVGPHGELYVLYLDLAEDRLDYEGGHEGRAGPPYAGRWKLVLGRSPDRGATWQESVVDEQVVPSERIVAFIPPFPSLAIDGASGKLYVAFHDARLGDPDVWLWTRERDGARWSGPLRVNDTRPRDGTAQYLPRLAVSPGGRLDVLYYDRRDDPENALNHVSLQSSANAGRSFTRRLRLSDRPFSSRVGFGVDRGLPDLGSRLGLVSAQARTLGVWSDTRAGTRISLKQDIARRVVAFAEPPQRLDTPINVLLIAGGAGFVLAGFALLALGRRERRAS